jgi:hydrophobic/amphiphilic exporter-1 (mainly G- bacteria), HAE1 family
VIKYFAQHPTAANMLMAAIIIVGIATLPKLQRDTFPVIPPTEVEIRVIYPGATPAEVEDTICQRIEDVLDGVSELNEVRCDARENLAIAVAQMHESADMGEFYDDIKSQIETISTFPEKVEAPTIVKLERTAQVASVAITGNMTPLNLKAFAEKVKERIKRDKRIAQVRVLGFSDQDIAIEIRSEALRRYGLGMSDVAAALERQSLDLPAGIMETKDGDLIVRFSGQRRTPLEFKNVIVLSGRTGGQVLLGDIATIHKIFDRPENKILFNGQRAAILDISKTANQDSLLVMEAIKQNLERERKLAPKGVAFEISQDVTSNIRDRLRILLVNGGQGLVLVFLSMLVFFGFRFSFWVTMGLPVSFLGAVFAMHTLGYTINMMTMVGLLVATGLLMDDAIVISENVAANIRKGKNALAAAVDGTLQVMPGVLSSFATTIMIVGPLAFLSGRIGAVLKFLPAVLLITLVISLIEAFLILPAHLRHSFDHMEKTERSRFHKWFDDRFEYFKENVFGPLVDRVVRAPYLIVGILLAIAMISFSAIPSGFLKFRAFPALESDVIQARILLPQGTPLARTEEVVNRVSSALKKLNKEFSVRQEGGRNLVKNVSVLFNTNVDAFESGSHLATISADLLRAEERSGTVDEMLNRWRELVGDVPDVLSLKFTDKERGVAGKAIDIRLHGSQLKQLKNASFELQNWLKSFKGVQDVSDDLRPGKPELQISLRAGAGSMGITARAIANEVRGALQGSTNIDVQLGKEALDVTVRLAETDRNSLEDLRYLTVRSAEGRLVPLSAVADISQTRGFARINRINGARTVTVQGKLDTEIANARELMGITKKKFLPKLKKKYPGLRFSFQGQGKESSKTGGSLTTNIMIGIIGIFLILSFQFRSYVQPIAVMLAIPMGFIGVVFGHLAMGLDLTMPSLVGFATLAGVVVNDNILLVNFIKGRLSEGLAVVEAARLAARERLRAILLTSLTSIAGLLPLLSETSTQAQFLIPLVASLAFGLLTATVLALVFVPAFFVILDDVGLLKIEARTEVSATPETTG